MNARTANQQNEELTIDLFNSSKIMAEKFKMSLNEAIDKKVVTLCKIYPQSATAWLLRGENAKKMID